MCRESLVCECVWVKCGFPNQVTLSVPVGRFGFQLVMHLARHFTDYAEGRQHRPNVCECLCVCVCVCVCVIVCVL